MSDSPRFRLTRRAVLLGVAIGPVPARPGGAAPAAEAVTDALVAAAKKEGTVVFHTSIEVSVCQAMIDGFNKHYPDIRVQLERSGAERILQRITQEYASNITRPISSRAPIRGRSSAGRRRTGWRRTCRPMSPNPGRRRSATPTACSRACARR